MVAVLPSSTPVDSGWQGSSRQSRKSTPYLLLIPGLAWLTVFFLIPLFTLGSTSLMVPAGATPDDGFLPAFNTENYTSALGTFMPQYLRSFLFAGIATLLALLIAYPLAYFIAFRSGRWKSLLLVLVVAPFFASFLIRTYAWKTILADDGFITSVVDALGVLPEHRILATPIAVVAGLTYNFLPFMTLPLYASLDRMDPRLIEAASDLYARPLTGFRRVTLPLSMPGVVGGTLLTFIPATGDYINAQLLGGPKDKMIGNVIEAQFIKIRDYPTAAAMSFVLLVTILILVTAYVRKAGTEELL
ncbi:MAG: transporter permease [Actinomycetota bacterium]|jgi:spermidine/putrescine transport system permease protein